MLDHSGSRRASQRDLQANAQEAPYLRKLPPHQTLRLVLAGTVRQFAGQTVILSEGSEVEEVFLVLRGMVTVGLYQAANPALWLYVSGPGTVVDMCVLLEPPVSPVSIRTLSDVEVLAVPRAVFVDVMSEETHVGYEILKNYCSRLSLINQVTLKEFSQESPGPSPN